jgi:hypothetical protein
VKKQAALITIPVVINTSTTEENLTTSAVSQPIALTVEEVIELEKDLEDSSTAFQHQATLAFRGTGVQPEIFLREDFFFNWERQCTSTPISWAKVLPNLSEMGIPMTILDRLTSTQLTKVLSMVIVILYHCKVQELGIPHYIHMCYRRADLTAAMTAFVQSLRSLIIISLIAKLILIIGYVNYLNSHRNLY